MSSQASNGFSSFDAFRYLALFAVLLLLCSPLVAAPNITSVVDAAAYGSLGRRPVVGSMATILGTDLASQTLSADSQPLPRSLGGTRVVIGEFYEIFFIPWIEAPILYVSPTQINIQVPWEAVWSEFLHIAVVKDGVVSNHVSMDFPPFAPAIFSMNGSGTGQGVVHIASGTLAEMGMIAAPSGSLPGVRSQPVRRGEAIKILCVGLGLVFRSPESGAVIRGGGAPVTGIRPQVTIGGIPAFVYLAALAEGFVGVYEVTAQVPTNASTGNAIPLTILGGTFGTYQSPPSNTVTIAIQ